MRGNLSFLCSSVHTSQLNVGPCTNSAAPADLAASWRLGCFSGSWRWQRRRSRRWPVWGMRGPRPRSQAARATQGIARMQDMGRMMTIMRAWGTTLSRVTTSSRQICTQATLLDPSRTVRCACTLQRPRHRSSGQGSLPTHPPTAPPPTIGPTCARALTCRRQRAARQFTPDPPFFPLPRLGGHSIQSHQEIHRTDYLYRVGTCPPLGGGD